MTTLNAVNTPHVWSAGDTPVAVIMISLNEGHNMESVLQNLQGWAQEVFVVDSYSQDETVDIALRHGVHVVQRRFRGFGDQWNFALKELPIKAPWTMKMDPDERLPADLKKNIDEAVRLGAASGYSVERRLWLMGSVLPIRQRLVRVWRTGKCLFTDISVNEHPIVDGPIEHVSGVMEHHDSPDLDHWLEKQNRYTTAEALITFNGSALADTPRFFGSALQRRMWLKKNFYRLPFRYLLLFLYYWLWQGTWRSGWVGYAWARLRADVMRLREFKVREMRLTGRLPVKRYYGPGQSDRRVPQYD
ncbi:MAG: glycosyltransferase family 2 protein [Verrucomicrobiae bacterium]|nr:glycosyltransferase family 2 protein [Verrucomicrobiae bacterium]